MIPARDLILIELLVPGKTEAGLVLPQNLEDDDQVRTARVVAVGPGSRTHTGVALKPRVKVGDRIAIHLSVAQGAVKITLNNKRLLVIPEGMVMGKLQAGETLGF